MAISERTEIESTNDLVEQLKLVPFAPPRLCNVDEITFKEKGTAVENAVNFREALTFLIFRELGGVFFNGTSDPLMKSAVTVIRRTYFPSPPPGSVRQVELIENSCHSNQCSAKLLVGTSQYAKQKAIEKAFDYLRQRETFSNNFISKRWATTIKKVARDGTIYWEITTPYRLTHANVDAR